MSVARIENRYLRRTVLLLVGGLTIPLFALLGVLAATAVAFLAAGREWLIFWREEAAPQIIEVVQTAAGTWNKP